MQKFRKYTNSDDHSYTLGAFPTWELIHNNSEDIIVIFIDEKFTDKDKMISELERKDIHYEIASSVIKRLSNKDNTYVVGVFKKKEKALKRGENHVLLHNISDMGNLGTIIRSMLAFGVKDLALVGNTCDIYNPRVIRASMGAIFKIRFKKYDKIEDYIDEHDNNLYLFMLSNDEKDNIEDKKIKLPYTLVMGNEGSGLPEEFERFGEKTFIPQSKDVDSLNLPIATSIGLYEFRRKL